MAKPQQGNPAEVQTLGEVGTVLEGLTEKIQRGLQISVFETDPPERLQGFQMLGASKEFAIQESCLRTVSGGMKPPRFPKHLFAIGNGHGNGPTCYSYIVLRFIGLLATNVRCTHC